MCSKINNLKTTCHEFDWDSIILIQDPIYFSYIDKDSFIEIYEKIIVSLDGEDDNCYIEDYFRRSPINNTLLLFLDDDVRKRFATNAMGMSLIPNLQEICEGESKKEKMKRIQVIKQQNVVTTVKRCVLSSDDKETKIRLKMQKEIDKHRESLNNESNPVIISKLNKKINSLVNTMQERGYTI
jgi:hypothetical protein